VVEMRIGPHPAYSGSAWLHSSLSVIHRA
jgi:hypothetical protein